jgi:hypothetical protein
MSRSSTRGPSAAAAANALQGLEAPARGGSNRFDKARHWRNRGLPAKRGLRMIGEVEQAELLVELPRPCFGTRWGRP